MESAPSTKNGITTRISSVDDAWNSLSDHQKIYVMKSCTKEFGISKDELRELLFTLPITEQEINIAYSINNGGAVIHETKDKVTVARVDKFLVDNTASITALTLDAKEISLQTITANTTVVEIENYEVDTSNAVDADIFTKYTIFVDRCKEFGYSVDVARERLIKDFDGLFNNGVMDVFTSTNLLAMQKVYMNWLAICDVDTIFEDDLMYEYRGKDNLFKMIEELDSMTNDIAKTLLDLTGVDILTGTLHDVYADYDVLPYQDVDALIDWMTINLKKQNIPIMKGQDYKFGICTDWIDFRKSDSFNNLLKQINLLIASCGHQIDIKYGHEDPLTNMWVKLIKL